MENITNLQKLIEKATSSSESIPKEMFEHILGLINSRVDMPKHAIAAISKRMALKNKNVLINIFNLLEYLGYECELSLYSQISTKQFLFKISGMLMNKDIDPAVKDKIMQTIYCWEQLFRPHEDLLPLFFTFYAGLLRNNFQIPHGYVSPYRPAKLKQYSKKEQIHSSQSGKTKKPKKYIPQPTLTEQQTFQQIREKLILTNEIIDNASPSENVKDNALLIEMVEQIKDCQKKVNETINANPSQKIMELALAANDDIFITYRRFKDLQRNKKPEPFILTELVSDILKEELNKKSKPKQVKKEPVMMKKVEEEDKKQSKKEINFLDMDDEPKKEVPVSKKKQQNILDLDYEPQKPANQNNPQGDIFDLLGDSQQKKQNPKKSSYDDLFSTLSFENPTSNQSQATDNSSSLYGGLNLNANDFTTDADIKNRQSNNVMDKLGDLSDFLKKK